MKPKTLDKKIVDVVNDFYSAAPKYRTKKSLIQTILSVIDDTVREIVDLSDKIELEDDNGLEEWKAFKRFRNTLRDRYL